MDHHDSRSAHSPEAATDEPASSDQPSTEAFDFDPIPLRYRRDGLTPERQRAYVEALADCGVAKEAASRIGLSEQAIARARRRADAKSFDLACEAAVRFTAQRVRSIAFERAIQGTIRRHYYHGELKSEERVYDNRLLVYLLGKLDRHLAPPAEAEAVADDWEPWMEAIEQGLPAPALGEADEAEEDVEDEIELNGVEVWEDNSGIWWTEFCPPADFAGEERGAFGEENYQRRLSPAEQAVVDAEIADRYADEIAFETARRDRYFGFAGGNPEAEVFSPKGPEPYGTSVGEKRDLDSGPEPVSPLPGRAEDGSDEAAADPPSPAEPAEPAQAEPPAVAELYEPDWLRAPGGPLCTTPARQDHSTVAGAGVTGPGDE